MKLFDDDKTTEMNDAKELRKDFFKTIVFLLAAFYVLVIATAAWFAHNTDAISNSSRISASEMAIELRTHGTAGVHDDVLKTIMSNGTENSFWYKLPFMPKDHTETSAAEPTINWLLTDESAVGNFSTENEEWEEYWKDSKNLRQEKAIEPGASGKLSFSVVPYYSGDITVHCNLSIIPYDVTEDGYKEIEDSTVEYGLMSGHILFFLISEDDELIWINNGDFELSIPDAVKEQEYQYTLYWCWPQTFAELVLPDGDIYLNGRKPLLYGYSNGEAIRKTIAVEEDDSMLLSPDKYFYSNLTNGTLAKDQQDLIRLADIFDCSTDNDADKHMDDAALESFVELSSYYNQADQYIGGHIKFVRIRLTAY